MTMKNIFIKFLVITLAVFWIAPANAQKKPANTERKPAITESKPAIAESKPANTERNLISGGYSGMGGGGSSGSGITASVFKIEYERKLSDLLTLTGGVGSLSYTSNNSGSGWTYTEDGKGTSLFVDVNFYPGRDAFNGFYVAPGIGITTITTTWTERWSSGSVFIGSNRAAVIDVHGKVGYKFKAGPVVIDPNVRLGYFLNTPTGGTSNDSNLGLYVLIGANVGMPF